MRERYGFRDSALTLTPQSRWPAGREMLLSYDAPAGGLGWLREMVSTLALSGVALTRPHTGPDTIRRVELGGLMVAVLVADTGAIDGLSILRIIRSIDGALPCWLVTQDTTRRALQEALSLRATRIITQPCEGVELARALQKEYMGPNPGN